MPTKTCFIPSKGSHGSWTGLPIPLGALVLVLALCSNPGSAVYSKSVYDSCWNRKRISLEVRVIPWGKLLEENEQATHIWTREAFLVGIIWPFSTWKDSPGVIQWEQSRAVCCLKSLGRKVISRHGVPRQPKMSPRNQDGGSLGEEVTLELRLISHTSNWVMIDSTGQFI